jgi:hypothetical protein
MFADFFLQSYRVVNDRDFITGIPKFLFVFKHIGTEVLIDKRGNLVTDLTAVEKMFSDSKRVFTDHTMEKYRRSLASVFEVHERTNSPASLSLRNLPFQFPLHEENDPHMNDEPETHARSESDALIE